MEGSTNVPTSMAEVTNDQSGSDDLFVFEDYNQRIAIATILCVVFLMGIVGNTLVITAVVLSRKLRSSTNWLVVNLGCSDLLTCLFLPFNVVAMLSRDGWPLPGWICATNSAVILICIGASVMTLAFIAYNRWYLLTKPMAHFQKLYTTRNICFMVLSAWVYPSLLVLVPHFAGLGRLGYSYEYKACTQDTSLPYSDLYSLIAGAGAIIPVFIAIVVIYVRIYLFVSRQSKKMDHIKRSGVRQTSGIDNINVEISSSEITSREPSTLTSDEASTQNNSTLNIDTCQTTEMNTVTEEDEITNVDNSPRDTSHAISDNQSKSPYKPTKPDKRLPKYTNQKSPGSKTQTSLNRYHVRVTKRLAIVVLGFFICLLPFGVSVVVPPSDPGVPWTGLMLTFNSCINPLIYARTMPEFRKVMAAIIRCRLKDIPEPISCIRRLH